MRPLMAVLCVLVAGGAGADTLRDVRIALNRLTATQPIRATFATEQRVKSKGRFANENIIRTASAEVAHDASGISITIPQALVERVASERRARKVSDDIARGPIGSLDTLEIADAIDFRESLLVIIENATVVSEKRATPNNRAGRVLELKLNPKPQREANAIRIGSVKNDETMRLWIGDDNLPFAAERSQKTTAGFMFIKGTFSAKSNYVFAQAGDRLILARFETSDSGSGMGQDIAKSVVQTLTVR